MVRKTGGEPAVWLVDDPGAELDPMTLDAILPLIFQAGEQTLVTGVVGPTEAVVMAWRPNMFHVERGEVLGPAHA
jgi:recombinational DNA repair ATPase RecF